MERKFSFSLGEYYHIYNRGADKRDIFLTNADRGRFQRMLHVANNTKPVVYKTIQGRSLEEIVVENRLVAVGAYCLMPNHFHLLLKEIVEGGITAFMSKLSTGYSMYFNTVNKRSGVLFQGRFKAEHVDRDEYLKYLYAYIHLNPVKLIEPDWKETGIKNRDRAERYLREYPYSSYADYVEAAAREEGAILDRSEFPEYFQKHADFKRYVKEWLEYARGDS